MAFDLKTATPDTSLPTTGFLFGADSQSAADPSVFPLSAIIATILGATAFTGETVTTSKPVLDLSQTWNAGAVVFTGLKFNAINTASDLTSILLDLQVDGVSKFNVGRFGGIIAGTGSTNCLLDMQNFGVKNTIYQGGNYFFAAKAISDLGAWISSTSSFGWVSSLDALFGTPDVILSRDAADVLALRHTTNAQTFRFYGTYTDVANNSYAYLDAGVTDASTFTLGSLGAGTSAAAGLTKFDLKVNVAGVATRKLDYNITTANFLTVSSALQVVGDVQVGGGNAFNIQTKFYLVAPSTGVITLLNGVFGDFSMIQLGGTTSSFPAIKKSSAIIQIRLADDSGDADLTARTMRPGTFTVAALPAAGTAGRVAIVTDQLTTPAAKGVAPTGGGAVVCTVMDTGAGWVGI